MINFQVRELQLENNVEARWVLLSVSRLFNPKQMVGQTASELKGITVALIELKAAFINWSITTVVL